MLNLRSRRNPVAPILAAAEPLALLLVAPLLLFPTIRPQWTVAGLALLAALALARWIVRGELWPATPFNVALLLFALMLPVAWWASAWHALPKIQLLFCLRKACQAQSRNPLEISTIQCDQRQPLLDRGCRDDGIGYAQHTPPQAALTHVVSGAIRDIPIHVVGDESREELLRGILLLGRHSRVHLKTRDSSDGQPP